MNHDDRDEDARFEALLERSSLGSPGARQLRERIPLAEAKAIVRLSARESREDLRRNVFVVYGRDAQAESAIFDFLRAIDLRPLEWELIVAATGKRAPSVAEAVRAALAMAHAVVVLMTPDDVVRLHPDLHAKNETTAETEDSMQARPNVLLELGMALMSHPTTTLVLIVGDQRPVTDLGGVNYLTIADTVECRQKIATRLQAAGCPVDLRGSRWHTAGDFGGLAALRRNPVAQAQPKASDEALDRPAVQSAPEDAGDAPATAASARDVLTVREREVAALVAEGLTNRDIAGRLVVSKRTVDAHVEHIVAKLGLASRVQIANAIRAADEDSPAGTRRLGSTSPTH